MNGSTQSPANPRKVITLADLSSYFDDMLRSAPEYGWCGINVTFHDGRPVKIEKNIGISVKSG